MEGADASHLNESGARHTFKMCVRTCITYPPHHTHFTPREESLLLDSPPDNRDVEEEMQSSHTHTHNTDLNAG